MEHVDYQMGRIVETLERIGELDNTLIFVTADNGASGEGGLAGTFNETYVLNGLQTDFDSNWRAYPDWGRENTYPHYHAGWAMAGNTPFKYFKQSEHRGGQTDALIVHWPNGIKAKGEIRSQFHHISDIAPTILEAAKVKFPESYHGIKQKPFDGKSMLYSFNKPDAPTVKDRQYFEMFGNRAIWVDGWKAVSLHGGRMPWVISSVSSFEDDVWELYNVDKDFSESNDLAKENPAKLEELKKIFDEEAWKYNVYPMYDDMLKRLNAVNDVLFGDQKVYTYYAPGAFRIAEKASAPVKGRSHTIETTINLKGGEEGVIVACGGMTGGYTMFIKGGRVYFDYNFLDGVFYNLESQPLPEGKVDIKFDFKADAKKMFSGIGDLYINGKKQDTVEMPDMHRSTYSLAETFDIGIDTGTQVSKLYKGTNKFTGTLDKVVITLTQ
jgi:arylsulfatase